MLVWSGKSTSGLLGVAAAFFLPTVPPIAASRLAGFVTNFETGLETGILTVADTDCLAAVLLTIFVAAFAFVAFFVVGAPTVSDLGRPAPLLIVVPPPFTCQVSVQCHAKRNTDERLDGIPTNAQIVIHQELDSTDGRRSEEGGFGDLMLYSTPVIMVSEVPSRAPGRITPSGPNCDLAA